MGRITEIIAAVNSKDMTNLDEEHYFHLNVKESSVRDDIKLLRQQNRRNAKTIKQPALF